MTTAFAAGLAAAFAVTLGSWLRFWWIDRGRGLPGPVPLPILGNLAALGQLPHRSLRDLSLKYRDGLFRMHLGSSSYAVILSREQSVREMHRQGPLFYARPNYEIARIFNLDGHGFSFTAGEQWTKVRALAKELLLSRARSLDMIPHIEAEADDLVTRLRAAGQSDGTCDIKIELQTATANLFMKIAWNRVRDSAGHRDAQLVHDLDLIFFNVGKPNARDYFPFLKRFPSKRVEDVRAARARVRVAMEAIIAEHRKTFDHRYPRDMIDVLLASADAAQLSDLDLQQMVAEMFIGAVVPGAMPITWAVLLLANKPEIQARLHSELAAARVDDSVSVEMLERQPFFQAFLSELLRLYGASPLIPRRSVRETTIAGYSIPADTEILVNYYGLHTDPELWPDPFAFTPERFLASAVSPTKPLSKSYMPFGKGGRNCPGKPLAEFELQLFLSRLILNFEFAAPKGSTVVPLDEMIGLALCPVHSRVGIRLRNRTEKTVHSEMSSCAVPA